MWKKIVKCSNLFRIKFNFQLNIQIVIYILCMNIFINTLAPKWHTGYGWEWMRREFIYICIKSDKLHFFLLFFIVSPSKMSTQLFFRRFFSMANVILSSFSFLTICYHWIPETVPSIGVCNKIRPLSSTIAMEGNVRAFLRVGGGGHSWPRILQKSRPHGLFHRKRSVR